MSTNGAVTSVSQVASLFPTSVFSLLLLCPSGRGKPGLAPETMSRITEGKALVIPVLRRSRDAAGGEIRDVILIYRAQS